MTNSDTIVALSSGALPSGVAIIRLSGPHTTHVLESLVMSDVEPRRQCSDGFWHDARQCASPAGMHGRHGVGPAIVEEHRHTVGSSHHHSHARLVRDQRVPTALETITFRYRPINDQCVRTVHLLDR